MGNGVYYHRTEQKRGFELLIELSKKTKKLLIQQWSV